MKKNLTTNYVEAYKKMLVKKGIYLILLFVLLIATFILSVSLGSTKMTFQEVFKTLFGGGDKVSNAIMFNLRIPRAMAALIVGAGLSIAGCIMQSVLRNPLASSSTLGVSQGASFGAAMGILALGSGSGATATVMSGINNPYLITIFAFLGSISSVAVILLLSRFKKLKPSSMILVGVALSSLFSGGLALIQYFASETAMASIVFWTFGDLGRVGWKEIIILCVVFALAFIFFIFNSWKYNAIDNGSDMAKSLGVRVETLTIVSMVVAALLAGASVAFVGIINFIGLVAPHIARRIVGNDHRFLIPASALIGAMILLLADLSARMIISPVILPIGAITSFLGAPLFLYLIFREKAQ